MRRTNYFKGYLPIYSLAFAEKNNEKRLLSQEDC